MNTDDWYYMDESESVVGPLTLREIHEQAKSRRIGPETQVWHETLEGWTEANSLEEFLGIGLCAQQTVEQQELSLIRNIPLELNHKSLIVDTTDNNACTVPSVPREALAEDTGGRAKSDPRIVSNKNSGFREWDSANSSLSNKICRDWASRLSAFAKMLFRKAFVLASAASNFSQHHYDSLTSTQLSAEGALDTAKNKNSKDMELEQGNEDSKKCPMCAEFVKYEARICRFCRFDFVHGPYPDPSKRLHYSLTEAEKSQDFIMGVIEVIVCIVWVGVAVGVWKLFGFSELSGFLAFLFMIITMGMVQYLSRRRQADRRFKQDLKRNAKR